MDLHVLYVKSRCEKKVAAHCGKHGLSHYLPLRRETKIYQRRRVTVEKPLFQGYVFAAFDSPHRPDLIGQAIIVHAESALLEPVD